MMSDMETKDWLNEFTALKQVNSNNPFTVPDGYFGDLRERTLSLVNLYKHHTETGGLTVPEGYFDELNGNISSRINISSAVNTEDIGFAVPQNYFEELAGNIQSRIAIEEMMQEAAGPEFAVPEGYFNNLQEQITARIAVEEAFEEAELEQAFVVPQGYFDKLNAAILSKTVDGESIEEEEVTIAAEPVQRPGVVRRLFASGIFKYAAAACITIGIGVSFLLYSGSHVQQHAQTGNHSDTYLHHELSAIPINEIRSYVEQNIDAGETQTYLTEGKQSAVSDEELMDYIDTEL